MIKPSIYLNARKVEVDASSYRYKFSKKTTTKTSTGSRNFGSVGYKIYNK